MTAAQKYRRISDGSIVDALQYGEGKPWTKESVTRVVEFVTGVDVDNHTGIAQERVLDVVIPILTDWDAANGKVPIQVSDTRTGQASRVELGDWIVKLPSGALLFIKQEAFAETCEAVEMLDSGRYTSHKEIEIEELATFMYKDAFNGLEMDFPEGIAHLVAPKIINAGWRKTK